MRTVFLALGSKQEAVAPNNADKCKELAKQISDKKSVIQADVFRLLGSSGGDNPPTASNLDVASTIQSLADRHMEGTKILPYVGNALDAIDLAGRFKETSIGARQGYSDAYWSSW